MHIGFIGTGAITQAVVTGLIRSGLPFERIALSPRNARIAAALAARDPRVCVCTSNQAVLDASDVVCLAVVPQIADDVLRALAFDARHQVVSFIAGMSIERVRGLVGAAGKVVRAIPLPAVADGKGSTAICPADGIAATLFAALGEAVEVDDERQFDALSAVTATMASFYAVLDSQAAWLARQGLREDAARAFLAGYCVGLAHETTRTDAPFSAMVDDVMTPGGLNAQLHAELSSRGTYAHYGDALDRVLARIEGRS
ncbi:pyrroline-5-carboxylate reductase [Burkholderia sp. 4701]|nr:pyrroline-5-carboxylate reductase [Burkholderia sp. 4701]MXN82768.1 pyrroline-5-carboxylate reductase [Burkholderia sp. 4812]